MPPPIALLIPAAMLLLALLHLPYGYYEFLRLVVTGSAVWIAIAVWNDRRLIWGALFALTGLLYNPLIRVHLDRETWRIVNVVTSVLFLAAFVFLMMRGRHVERVHPPARPF